VPAGTPGIRNAPGCIGHGADRAGEHDRARPERLAITGRLTDVPLILRCLPLRPPRRLRARRMDDDTTQTIPGAPLMTSE